ncbi:ubiquinol-cytochrome-c reductase complex subunit-domain-containing protein [Colletotrichum phormii]|uniref:Ubiquinol-cytochrome-c reductase complex subunit-domain-containing protein n=1 Tax=Colletotrichum phormii TaxID=359342 RepID=A0AAI9ZF37_9PEZI|nr:ubiquinol-cytochrome-c reductase complex subunit-domain-containing protein [Colletotrichum phormii]KAK1623083.1 ubiquinol-cytochrome-c reductase complex subunit-domain-containing protein [Colletotrichum phormii]
MPSPARVGTLYPAFRSKFGPKYNTIPNIGGWTIASVVKLGTRAAGFGATAGVAALFYTSGIPRFQNDILIKIPIIGPKFAKEVPPASDNPF